MGVRCLDTAQAYGRSEEIIGGFCVISRSRVRGPQSHHELLPDADPDNPLELGALLEESWKLLGSQPIWGLLLHRETMLDRWEGGFGETLRSWRDQGRIRHLGVSIRSVEGMAKAIASPDMEIIQAPASAFDRRMHRGGLFAQADAAGKKVFIRSVFLQGLVFLTAAEAIRRIPPAAEMLKCLDTFCAQRRIDRRRFAIGYARHRAPSATLVIGAETAKQIGENCQLAGTMLAHRICTPNGMPCGHLMIRSWSILRVGLSASPVEDRRCDPGRMGSSRLPGKVLMTLFDQPVIQWVYERARRIEGVDDVVVATTTAVADDCLAEWCVRHGMRVFRGSERDVLGRYVRCARTHEADAIVRITADCPLLDPSVSGKVLAAFVDGQPCDYASNTNPPRFPDGLDTEVISRGALEISGREASG